MNRTEAINKAIEEFETVLKNNGFVEGINANIDEETKPMYWQGTSPLKASSKEMYLIFNFTDEISKATDNTSTIHDIYINFGFYTTRNLKDVEFNNILKNIENELSQKEFNVEYEPDSSQAQQDPDIILNCRNVSINKILV